MSDRPGIGADDGKDVALSRYARQMGLPEVGPEGQARLRSARVLVVGAGGLGSPILWYLAAAGVGTLGIADPDVVSPSNLNRQILYGPADLGRPKTEAAREKLLGFNPDTTVKVHPTALGDENAEKIVGSYDLVLSAVDSRASRRVINRACHSLSMPWIDGGVDGFSGMVAVFRPPEGPCYECLTRGAPEDPGHVPMLLGALAGTIGLLQAQEALKLLLSIGKSPAGRVLFYDALQTRFDAVELARDPACPVCGGTA